MFEFESEKKQKRTTIRVSLIQGPTSEGCRYISVHKVELEYQLFNLSGDGPLG